MKRHERRLALLELGRISPEEKWADLQFVICVLSSAVITAMEIHVFLLSLFAGEIAPGDAVEHLTIFVLWPTSVLFLITALGYAVKWCTRNIHAHAYVGAATGVAITFVAYVAHSRFPAVDTTFAVPMLVTVPYASIAVTTFTGILSIAAKSAADIFILPSLPYTHAFMSGFKLQLDLQISTAILLFTYASCIVIIRVEKAKQTDIARHRRTQERLVAMTMQDALTGVGNRLALSAAFRLLEEEGKDGVFAMIDMDHFKEVNDTYGHQVGDRYIMAAAGLLAGTPGARAFRFGGDEFCLLLPGVSARRAAEICEGLLADFGNLPVCTEFRRTTLSFGLAGWHRGIPLEEILRRADEALYEAKRTRGCVRVHAA